MRILTSAVVIAGSLFLQNCKTTPYQAKSTFGGYSEIQLSRDTFEVRYDGNAWTKAKDVEQHLLHRCAELTKLKSYDYFTMVRRSPLSQAYMTAVIQMGNGTPPLGQYNVHRPADILKNIQPTEKLKKTKQLTKKPPTKTKKNKSSKKQARTTK